MRPPLAAGVRFLAAELRREFLNDLVELLQHALHIAHDRDIGIAVLADFGGIDVHVDDAGVAGEGVEGAGDAVVEAGAERDQQIAFRHRHVGGIAAVHAGHADVVRVAGGESAQCHQRGDSRASRPVRRIP